MVIDEIIAKIAIPIIFGSVAGAIVSWFSTKQRQQIDVSLKLIDNYLSRYKELAEVSGLLKNSESLKDNNEMNRVRAAGDWYELVAITCKYKVANSKLIEHTGIGRELKEFRILVEQAGLNDLLVIWEHVKKFK